MQEYFAEQLPHLMQQHVAQHLTHLLQQYMEEESPYPNQQHLAKKLHPMQLNLAYWFATAHYHFSLVFFSYPLQPSTLNHHQLLPIINSIELKHKQQQSKKKNPTI